MREFKIVYNTLKEQVGWKWILYFIEALFKSRCVFSKTKWYKSNTKETRFVKRLSFISALYNALKSDLGEENAFSVVKKVIVNVGFNELLMQYKSLKFCDKHPTERLKIFNEAISKEGIGQFNKIEYIKQNKRVCHFIIKRCIIYDFFLEAATPQLTKAFCDVNRVFFSVVFPEFKFHRNGLWENTIAYGKSFCEFVFELKGSY